MKDNDHKSIERELDLMISDQYNILCGDDITDEERTEANQRMTDLIKQRSQDQIDRMELEKGL